MKADLRKKEHDKYCEAYKGVYGMGKARKLAAHDAIDRLEFTGSFLDVGCGRGEILDYAKKKGFEFIRGVDVVPDLLNESISFGEAYDLPFEDDSFDVVTCFDVIEHLLPEDTELALSEFGRVARKAIILSAANYISMCNGRDLHINKRPYEEWDNLIRKNIKGHVEWLKRINNSQSETWVITR